MKIITFLSDFGKRDWFVAAVKGEILKIASDVRIVDITHSLDPCDIRGAAFLLHAVYDNFPEGTVHLAVVDPGVGSVRKPLIVESFGHFFVGPDNGIFSYFYNPDSKVHAITVGAVTSVTFHARDIFGPTAARLATGVGVQALGEKIDAYEYFKLPQTKRVGDQLCGEIVYIDHFGNCITNIPVSHEVQHMSVAGYMIRVVQSYQDGMAAQPICVRGSVGYYEIACYKGSAQAFLGVAVGTSVEASWS
jgi:S-adenosylmethionine hydrolase